MTHSHHSSSGSVSCRLAWRPSRWLTGVLTLLGILAALSVLASEMPRLAAWPLALSALAYGLWRAWRESRSPVHDFFFPGNDLPVMLDGVPIDLVEDELILALPVVPVAPGSEAVERDWPVAADEAAAANPFAALSALKATRGRD